jgi:hypothetical protein
VGSRQRQDHVLAVARDDDERARPDSLEHVTRFHRADRHAVDDAVEVRAGVNRLAADALEDHAECRVRQDRPDRQDAEERDAVLCEAALEDASDPRLGLHVDLVDDRPGDLDPVRPEQRRIEDDLVDRPADATLADDHRRRPEHARDDRVRQPDDRADAGVTGPLHEQDLVVAVGAMGRPDPRPEVLDDLAGDVRLREAPGDVDRAHHSVGLGQPERLLHEDRVLVGRLAVLDHGPLANGLEEPGPQAFPDEPVEQPERRSGLTAVLAGCREVELAHRRRVSRGRWSCAR